MGDVEAGTTNIKCSRCTKLLPVDKFPIITRGSQKGQRTKNCSLCLEISKNHKRSRRDEEKENGNFEDFDPALRLCSLDGFITILTGFQNIVELEAILDISNVCQDSPLTDYRTRAQKIAERISDAMGYFFQYHSFYAGSQRTRYVYHCAQNKERQKQHEKVADPKKQRDKTSMSAFSCDGWLSIIIWHQRWEAGVRIRHKEDHVPYCVISLPEDVRELIKERYREPVTQLWTDILKRYPKPQFGRHAVSYIWSKLNQSEWKRDPDQLNSAKKILEEAGRETNEAGYYRAEIIDLPAEDGFSALAWCLPDMLIRWGGRIREVALDSAWETNGMKFELYALLGEAYATGLPLGFCLLRSENGSAGGIERHLTVFLNHFKEKWNIDPIVGLSDKNMSEINSMLSTLSNKKHQLCFWHCLRAVKKRLSILRRMPAYYNVVHANEEFPWIDKNFLPVAQLKGPTDNLYIAKNMIPTLTIKFNGRVCTLPAPGRECLKIRLPPLKDRTNLPEAESESTSKKLPSTLSEMDEIVDEEDEELDSLLKSIETEGNEEETDDEDGPDWMFDEDEKRSPDPNYVFCPAPHRLQILRMFTKHFCEHPMFPDATGYHSATEIRNQAVREIYQFCYVRGLREVWAYLWTSWYQPKMWKLWARSSSPYISRWRTTMGVENFWKQLKHDYLHHLVRPRIDQLVWIIQNKVVPNYMVRAVNLEDVHRFGRARKMTAFQVRLKKEWSRLAEMQLSGRTYQTDVETWTCNCGALKYNSFHICKHLVQAVPRPPHTFFAQVFRRRVRPLYRHPALCPIDAPVAPWLDPDDGSITDGDDHNYLGDESMLTNGNWRTLLDPTVSLGKRPASTYSEANTNESSSPDTSIDPDLQDSPASEEPQPYADEEELEELDALCALAKLQLDDWRESVDIVARQIDAKNPIWLRSFTTGIGKAVQSFRKSINRVESTGHVRKATWPRNLQERRTSRHVMGYQVRTTE